MSVSSKNGKVAFKSVETSLSGAEVGSFSKKSNELEIKTKQTSRGKRPEHYDTKIQKLVFALTSSEILEIKTEIDRLAMMGVEYQILTMIGLTNYSGVYIAQKLGWTYQDFTEYLVHLFKKVKISKVRLRNIKQYLIFGREIIRRVFR